MIAVRALIIPAVAILLIIAMGRAKAEVTAIDCKLIRALAKIETPAELEQKAREGGDERADRRGEAMPDPRLIPGCLLSAALIVIATLSVVAGTAYAARMLAGLLYQFGLR